MEDSVHKQFLFSHNVLKGVTFRFLDFLRNKADEISRKIWNYFFCSTAFVDKIIKGNTTYNLFFQLMVNMGKYLPILTTSSSNKLYFL